jgi:hypothetical protein
MFTNYLGYFLDCGVVVTSVVYTCLMYVFWCVDSFPMCCVNFNIWMRLFRDGKVRVLKLEYTVQQDAGIQY